MNLVDKKIRQRAIRAFKCMPFNIAFYNYIQKQGLSAEYVCKNNTEYLNMESNPKTKPEDIEDHFRWLIKIGILRREVDGQGLTSKIRLTPLGRKILQEDPTLPSQKPNKLEELNNWRSRAWPFR